LSFFSFSFWPFIVLSVLLRFTDSDYPFGILKLFLWHSILFTSTWQISLPWHADD
jgi:hypothetical protein